ncbi:MAG TPA: glycosyltransferase family 39 protein [Geobacteraceae bacterium]|mgnify:CR=1 FL=1|nr:glycosyltransferase family 39 protein [Geobacteraceae bacterium]
MHAVTAFLSRKQGRAVGDLAVITIVFGLFFLVLLGNLPLLEPDEGRYAEIPREMLERADFVSPYLNYVKYFEKPPLHYWVNAASLAVFGPTEFAVRFPSALLGLSGVLLTYCLGRRVFGRREGLYGALVLASSLGYLALGRVNSIDMTLTFCMTATLGFFFLASRDAERRKGLFYHLFYVFAALTVLAKGLIGIVLPGGVVFVYLMFTRRWRLLREMRLLTGVPLFLAVCAPWFVLVSLKNPEFPRFFFIHEHFERFLTKVHKRYEPPWFFIPVILLGLVPWTFFLPEAVRNLWRTRDERKLYLVLWAGVIFTFFSASSSKLIPYMLPVFPALALLVGATVSEAFDRDGRSLRGCSLVAAAFLSITGVGVTLYPYLVARPKIAGGGALATGCVLMVGGILALVFQLKQRRESFLAALCLTVCLCGVIAPPVIFARSLEKKSTRELAKIVRERYPDAPLISYGYYRQDLPFYTGRRVIVAGSSGELEFGRRRENEPGWFIGPAEFFDLWDSSRQVVTLIGRSDYLLFRRVAKSPARVVGEWGETLLITNR